MAKKGKRTKAGVPKATRSVAVQEREDEGWRGLWHRLSGTTQHAVCIVFLIIVSFAYFAPIHFSGKSIVAGDVVNWRAMAEDMIQYREQEGEEPLWAPNAFAGMPGYKISYELVVPQLDDIPRILRLYIWPSSHFIFLLIGTYLLVFFLTRNRLAGVLSAVGYGLTTYLTLLLVAGHNSKFVALAFIPWAVLAFAYVLRRPGILSSLLFAIAMAVNVRAGHEQITYYLIWLLAIWWIVEAVGAIRGGRFKNFGAVTGWMALSAVITVLLVAQPYLAVLEHRPYTIRGVGAGEVTEGLGWDYAMNWSQGIGELVTLIIAHAFGGSGANYWGPKPFTAGPHYMGGVVLLLAVLAVWRVRKKAVWGLAIAAFVMILFSLGSNLAWFNRLMFEAVPLFDAFRAPETWLSVVVFAVVALAGIGASYVIRREPSPQAEQEKTKSILIAVGSVAGLVLVLLLMRNVFFEFERPNELMQLSQMVAIQNNVSQDDPRVVEAARQFLTEVKVQRAEVFADDALRTLIFVLLAGGAIYLYRRGTLPGWVMQTALVLLVLIDLWGVDRRYLNEEGLVDADTVEEEIPTYDFDRFLIEQGAGERGQFRVLSLESDPQTWARPSYFYESLGGYHGAKLALYQDFLDHLLFDERTGIPNQNALNLLNTRYVISPRSLPGMNVVFQGERFVVLENPDALPRAFFVGEVEVVASSEEMWARLLSESFEPEEVALLSEPIDFETNPIDSGSVAEVTLEGYSPREIVWNVRTDAPRLMVASEVYYPAGWNAYVDGEEVPIHRVDYLLRAVPVPEGEHTVVMRFEPVSHRIGVAVSGFATVFAYGGVLLILGLAWNRRRRTTSQEQ